MLGESIVGQTVQPVPAWKNGHHLLHGSAKQSGKGVLVLDRKRQSCPLPTPKPLHESLQIFNGLIT